MIHLVGLSLATLACGAELDSPSYDLRVSLGGRESPLTLNQAIARALRCNLDVKIESIAPQVEADRVLLAEAEFDPAFESRFRYDTLQTPQTSQEFVSTGGNRFLNGNLIGQNRIFAEDNFEAKTGIVGKLRSGAEYDFGVRGNRYVNDLTRDPTVALFNPEYRTFTGVTFLQPLLRDFGRSVNEAQISVSQKDKAIADQVFRQKLAATIREVIVAYNEAFLAYEDLKVKRFEVNVLRRMAGEKSDQLERGAATEADLALVRSTLSESYERFLLSRQALLAKNGDLLLLLQEDFDFEHFPVYLPVDAPSGLRPTLDPKLLVSQSIQCRPEYLMAVQTVEKLGIVLKYRDNQTMPRIDLEGTIGYSGLNGSYGGAFSNTFDSQGTEYGIGLVVNVPLGNTEKKALYAETENQRRQALLKLKQEELKAHILINQHVTAVETHERRLLAARHSTRLEMANLEKARESLEKGTTSEVMVLQVERDISETTLRQHAASADMQNSLADLWEANGTLLTRYGIGVCDATLCAPARITSSGETVRSRDVVVAEVVKRPARERPVSVKEGGALNPLESGFRNLFVRTEEGSRVSTDPGPGRVLVVASPVATPVPESGGSTAGGREKAGAGPDSPAPPLVASPVKPKGIRGIFRKE